MNRGQAIKLKCDRTPCYYNGRYRYLKDKPLYIQIVEKKTAIVNLTPELDYGKAHTVSLENLITEEQQRGDSYAG